MSNAGAKGCNSFTPDLYGLKAVQDDACCEKKFQTELLPTRLRARCQNQPYDPSGGVRDARAGRLRLQLAPFPKPPQERCAGGHSGYG